jgi:O-antigen/teichoic acid export membrane protein
MVKLNRALMGGSIVLLFTINIYNLLNFIFQWSMARMLSIVEYGELAALISIIYLLAVFTESMQTVIAKYASLEPEEGKIKNLIKRSLRKSLKMAFIGFLVYLIISIFIAPLLKIDYLLLALNGLLIFPIFLAPAARGVLQGKKLFSGFGFAMMSEGIVKVALGLLFVFLGLRVYGAVTAIILAVAFSFCFSLIPLRKFFSAKEKEAEISGVYGYAQPVLLANAVILVFSTVDVLIAKIVFDSISAGYYALSSVIAKIIFLGTGPISKALFPITAELKDDKKKASRNAFFNALTILLLILLIILPIFYFFPDLLVRAFSGKYVSESANILFYLALAFSFCSITNLVLMYNLSRNPSSRSYYWLFSLVLLELVLFFVFSSSLKLFSIAFIALSICFLIASIVLIRK